MASSITVNGKRTSRPGTYGELDTSQLGGSDAATGNVLVIGKFPEFERNKPYTYTRAQALAARTNTLALLTIAGIAFDPSDDPNVPGGAQTLTFLNVQPSTQAHIKLQDDQGRDALTLKSRLWGPIGNRLYLEARTNTEDARAMDLLLVKNGKRKLYSAMTSGDVASIRYTGADLDTATLSANSDRWTLRWSKALTLPGGDPNSITLESPEILSDNAPLILSLILPVDGDDNPITPGEDVTITITGEDHEGVPNTETLTVESGGGQISNAGVTDTAWSKIQSITCSTNDQAFAGIINIEGIAFSIATDAEGVESVGDIVATIGQEAGNGWDATALHPKISTIPAGRDPDSITGAGGVDDVAALDIKTAAQVVTADLWHVATTLQNDPWVEVAASTSATGALRFHQTGVEPALEQKGRFSGGSLGATTDKEWDAGFKAAEEFDLQIVVPWSDDVAIHKKTAAHCVDAQLYGTERQAWVGATENLTLAQVFERTSAINNGYAALVAQEIQVRDPRGRNVWLAPMFLALMMAGMQAGTPAGSPLTWKRPKVLDVRQHWNPNLDANEAIEKGICVLSRDNLGWKVERSVTTHLTDDNPIDTEVSALESGLASLRDLRLFFRTEIGQGSRRGQAALLKARVEDRLNEQRDRLEIIKDWRSVQVVDSGDYLDVTYEFAPIESTNFVTFKAIGTRIAS